MIIISYMKPYNCLHTNDYNSINIFTGNHIVMYEILVPDRNT